MLFAVDRVIPGIIYLIERRAVMGVSEGKLVGDTLRHILDMVINGELSNEIEPQMQAAQQYLALRFYE